MFKSIIVLSKLVDSTLREAMPDVDCWIFSDVQELTDYINDRPLRGETLYITQEMLQHATTVVPHLVSLLENPFLNVDEVVCMCTKGTKEWNQMEALVKHYELNNWTVLPCTYAREQIFGIITGSRRDDLSVVKRKIIYRVPRSKYVEWQLQEKQNSNNSLEEDYLSDSLQLSNIESEDINDKAIMYSDASCEIVHIACFECTERTVFAFLSAQYLACTGKTVILERDIQYHRLSDFVLRSHLNNALIIDMEEALKDIPKMLRSIRMAKENLICLVCKARVQYDYSFWIQLLYNNLHDNINYLVSEEEFKEVPASQPYTAIIPTLVPDLFKAVEQIDAAWVNNANFVGVSLDTLYGARIPDSNTMELILQDVFNVEKIESVIVHITSLVLGESPYDLKRALFKEGGHVV